MTDPIPQADEADLAEQARPVEEEIDEYGSVSGEYEDAQAEDADGGVERQPAASGFEE